MQVVFNLEITSTYLILGLEFSIWPWQGRSRTHLKVLKPDHILYFSTYSKIFRFITTISKPQMFPRAYKVNRKALLPQNDVTFPFTLNRYYIFISLSFILWKKFYHHDKVYFTMEGEMIPSNNFRHVRTSSMRIRIQ